MYTTYGMDWRFGMVAHVKPGSCYIFEGQYDYHYGGKHTTSFHESRKVSSNQLLLLSNEQAAYVVDNCAPFIRTSYEKEYEEFMKEFDEYLKHKGWS